MTERTTRRKRWVHTVLQGIALLALIVTASASHGASLCNDCHGMPPIDAAYRNITSGGFKGSHRTHNPAIAAPSDCSACHQGSAAYATGHLDSVIQLSTNVNSSPVPALYSKGVFFNQTSIPAMGTCSNANCHFEKVTPSWGSTPFTSPADCGACHGAPPADGSHPALSGSGKKHGDYYGTGTGSCIKCHPDHAASANPFSHVTSAGQRALIVQFTATPNTGGTYSATANLAYPAYLPSQTPAASRNGSCSALYCHSNGNGSAPNTVPVWGGSLPADCTGCHNGNATTTKPMASGSHTAHMNTISLIGTNYGCVNCHSATASADNDQALVSTQFHANGAKSINFRAGGTYTAASKSCSATVCHAAGKATAPQPAVPVWGGTALGCNGCHGTGNALGMPDYANGGAATALANSHAKHVLTAADCGTCHIGTTTTGTNITAGSLLHTNEAVDVSFNGTKAGTGAVWTAAGKTCSATYCHGAGTPVWGGTLTADCTGCHGNDAGSAVVLATGKHTAHMNNAAILGTGNSFGCSECHAKTVSGNRTISVAARHADGFMDYSGVRAGKSSTYNGTTKVCSASYCHSNGNPAALVYVAPPAWNSATVLGCNGCHGTSNTATGAPDYANGGAGTATANSHAKHVAGSGITDTRGCANCHARTVDAASAGKLRNFSTLHLNRSPNVYFSAGVGGTYASTNATCSATYCHGTAASPAWGSASLACNACHAANAAGTAATFGAHGKHWESTTALPTSYTAVPGNKGTATQYQFECTSCHAAPATHAGGAANSLAAAQIYFGYSTVGRKGSYTYGTATQATDNGFEWTVGAAGSCNTTYCHSDGNGGNGLNTTYTWGSSGVLGCVGCHGGNAASAAPIATGKHGAHINNAAVLGSNFGCADCHARTVSTDTAISNKLLHVNKFKDYSGIRAGGRVRYNVASKTCSNIYCHSSGKGTYVTPAAWNSAATMGCNGCHGTTNTLGMPDYANGGAATANANSHAKHAGVAADCGICHSTTTTSGTAIVAGSLLHVNGTINVAFTAAKAGASAAWNPATKGCATTYCHGTGTPAWGATLPTDCTGCHGGTSTSSRPVASNSHPTHMSRVYGPGSYLGSAVTSCQACHDYSSTQPNAKHSDGSVQVLNAAGSACLNCHAGSLPAWTSTARIACTVCHSATPARLPNGIAASYKANFTTTGHGQFVQCADCHDQDAPHISGALGDAVRLYQANDNGVCASCHDGSFARVMKPHVLDKNATPTPDLCKTCHDVHGTTNLHMIRTVINGKTITFTNTSTGFIKTTAPYDGLCQACHTLTSHYRAGQALDGHPTKNCLSCHSHSTGSYAFEPASNCDSCHGYPPAPAGFVGRLGNYTSARAEDYLGGSGAHTIAAHVKPTAKASEGWANCTNCHGNGVINPATHTMLMPVTPSKITVDVQDKYKFNPGLPLGPAQYSGVLQDGGTNATGSCSNVSCHFKASKKWSTVK